MAKVTLTSPLRQIRSGNIPTAATLPDGCTAIGKVNGVDCIFVNEGGTVRNILSALYTKIDKLEARIVDLGG